MKNSENTQPPEWAVKFLRWFCKSAYLEDIEGDLKELFAKRLELYGKRKATWFYILNVIKLFRPGIIYLPVRININSNAMIKNNIRISLRVFSRNKSYSFINILSLTSALTISMLILAYVHFQLSYEQDDSLADRVVRITMDYLSGGTLTDQDAEMYNPAGPALEERIPEVIGFTRVRVLRGTTVQVGQTYYRETGVYMVDSSFFRLFDQPLIRGNVKNIFAAPYEVVLTSSLAEKYFGNLDVIGKSVRISMLSQDLKIVGVIHDSPANTHLPYRILMSYPTLEAAFGSEGMGWDNNNTYTYLLLSPGARLDQLQVKLDKFTNTLHSQGGIKNERIVAQPIKDIHLYSHKSFEATQNGDARAVFILLGVSILVIIIAIVNYINLSTAKSLDRAKEVGIRKVVGSSLRQIRAQFFTESLLINLFSAIMAIATMFLVLPAFIKLAGLPKGFSLWHDPGLMIVFAGVVIISSIASGAFPAFILSALKPIQVLKGKFSRTARGTVLRKTLVVFQFSITIFLLIQTFTAGRQLRYMRNMDLGMNADHTMVVYAPNDRALRSNEVAFKTELLTNPHFDGVSISSCVPGLPTSEMASTNVGVTLVGATVPQSYNFYIYWIDAGFLSTMRITLLAGENFRPENKNDDLILVNEESIRLWGIPDAETAIGKMVNLWGAQRTIDGVIKNFHQTSPKSPVIPMIFFHSENQNRLISIRMSAGDLNDNLGIVKRTYRAFFPDSPFEFFFLNQEFAKQFRYDEQFESVFTVLTGFAILISCLGLFGLVSFSVTYRIKEIGIRKVLGANTGQIASLLSRDFISLILMAISFSLSVTYFFVKNWLSHYASRIKPGMDLFLVPVIAVLLISLATILIKTLQVSLANPVKALKEE